MRLGRTLVLTAAAVVALTLGTSLGDVHGHLRQKLFAWIGAAAFLAFAVLAVRTVTGEISRLLPKATVTNSASLANGVAGSPVVPTTRIGPAPLPVTLIHGSSAFG